MPAHFPRPKQAAMPMMADRGEETGKGEPGDGTELAGYVTPDLGPFECENCVHFDGQSSCDHPVVIADPDVNGMVEPEGCCNYFKSAHAETQEQEHEEGPEDNSGGTGGSTGYQPAQAAGA